MNNKLNKKPLFFLILLFMLLSVGSTLAIFTSDKRVVNKFKTMTYNVKIEEKDFEGKFGAKKVFISNIEESNVDVVVRVNFNERWEKDNLILSNNINGENVVKKNWTSEFSNNFIKASDGWYYYKKPLKAKNKIQILDSIELREDLISNLPDYSKYKDYNYELSFNLEAIQASKDAVKDIWNYDISINRSDIIWPF